jgi:hypothetical protein
MKSVARRAGCSRRTLYRYLNDPSFKSKYQAAISTELASMKGAMVAALYTAALDPESRNQVAALKLYWTLVGDLRESFDVNMTATVETVNAALPYDRLSLDLRRRMLAEHDATRTLSGETRFLLEMEMKAIQAKDDADLGVIDVTPQPNDSNDSSQVASGHTGNGHGRRRTILPVLRSLGHPVDRPVAEPRSWLAAPFAMGEDDQD